MMNTYANITAAQIELLRAFKPQHEIEAEENAAKLAALGELKIELVEFYANFFLSESTATFLVNSQEIKFGKFEKYQLSEKLARNLYQWEDGTENHFNDSDWDEENGGVKNEDGDFVSPYSDEEIHNFTIENFNDVEMDIFEETFPEDFANMKNILCNIEPPDEMDEELAQFRDDFENMELIFEFADGDDGTELQVFYGDKIYSSEKIHIIHTYDSYGSFELFESFESAEAFIAYLQK